MAATRYFNATWPFCGQPEFTSASTTMSKAVCVRKSMTITHCVRWGLDSIYSSFLRLWKRSGNRKCIFITPAGQQNLIGQLLNVGGMQRLAHSSFVLRVGIHPERMRCTSLHVQITKRSKNNVVNLLSQIKSPERLDFGEPSWKGRACIGLLGEFCVC